MTNPENTKDTYKCPSYYDDSNVLQDCTCSKCGNTKDSDEMIEINEIYRDGELVEVKASGKTIFPTPESPSSVEVYRNPVAHERAIRITARLDNEFFKGRFSSSGLETIESLIEEEITNLLTPKDITDKKI